MARFFGDFSDADGVFSAFQVPPQGEILAAAYDCGNYDGTATVIWRGDDGRLYEIHGSHCSCSGLEDQWEPELVHADELRARMSRDGSEFALYVLTLIPPTPEG